MINELRAVAIFVEVVRIGSFRGAAKLLNLSPSAVSYNVAQLEKRVGSALIYRSTRKLSLTKEGENLFEDASELLTGIGASLEQITGSSSLQGRLIISATSALLHSTLNAKITKFCRENSNVDVEIHYSDERQDLIGDGIDVVLRAGDMPDSSLKSKLIMRIERKLVCSKAYYKSQNPPRKPQDLNTWQWIKLAMMPAGRTMRKSGKAFTTASAASQISVNNIDAMVQFCSLGMGLATPPAFLVEKLVKRGSLVEVLADWQVDSIPVYAVWPGNTVRNRHTQKFIDLISDLN